ncbi:transposase [Mesorhizobium sp.]|uniref:IS66-like element accessory protein TnpA n=1 Tax=Mesorhizobium sp. TaxID=1871066 RepID=UPI000FE7BF53|nr:transposase [Mesorhizobium sp.]RWA78817.1 MAG: transposase [Mesorhizobium sp.]
MEEGGQKLRVRLVGRNGRRRYDPASKDRLVAACLEPGVSVSRLALEHGVNANLLWKWIRQHRLAQQDTVALPPPSTPAFIPVQIENATDRAVSRQNGGFALDLRPNSPGVRLPESAGTGRLCSPAKVSASLPNGVKLTLECDDVDALTATIGALGHVQTGR